MEQLSKDKLADIVQSYYAKGMTYAESMNYINQCFILSKEDCIWCEDVWRGCVNSERLDD